MVDQTSRLLALYCSSLASQTTILLASSLQCVFLYCSLLESTTGSYYQQDSDAVLCARSIVGTAQQLLLLLVQLLQQTTTVQFSVFWSEQTTTRLDTFTRHTYSSRVSSDQVRYQLVVQTTRSLQCEQEERNTESFHQHKYSSSNLFMLLQQLFPIEYCNSQSIADRNGNVPLLLTEDSTLLAFTPYCVGVCRLRFSLCVATLTSGCISQASTRMMSTIRFSCSKSLQPLFCLLQSCLRVSILASHYLGLNMFDPFLLQCLDIASFTDLLRVLYKW